MDIYFFILDLGNIFDNKLFIFEFDFYFIYIFIFLIWK